MRSSPNFGELPRKNLCGQVAQVLTPSPRVDLVREKGTEGLCVRIFHQLLFGQVVLEGSSSPIHTLCARQRRQVFFAMLHGQRTGELFNLVNNFVISNVLGTETAPGHVTIAEDTSASFLNVLEKFTLVDLVQVLCRGTRSWTGDNWSGQSYIRLPSYFDMCSLRAIKDVVVRTLINTPTPPQRNPSNGEKMHVLPRRIMHRGPTTPTTLALVCLARLHTLCREMIYHTDEFIDHC